MEIETETDTAGGETRNTVPAEVVSGESVTGGEIFAVDDIFEVEEVTEAEPADIAYSETDETAVLSSGADDSSNFIVEISYNDKKYEHVAPGNELLDPTIMNALGVPNERRDGFSTSDPGKEYFSIGGTELSGQVLLSVKKRFDGEQYIDVKLFSRTYRLTLKCKELPPVTYVTYDSGEREEITTTDYYYALTAGSFQSGKFYVVDRSFVRTYRIPNYADVDHPAHLILMDGCKMTVNGGIQNCSGHSLIIHQGHQPGAEGNGTGELVCTTSEGGWEEGAPNPDFAAAIGGDQNNGSGGHLRIDGGIITATSGTWDSAGIGGSYDSGYITINGGSVTATGGGPKSAVGIGAGGQGKVNKITINGGYVNASGTTNGIGGGTGNTSGEIVINGGKVDAAGGTGMGGGNNLTVTITGGEVCAKSWGSENPAFRGNKPVIAEGFTVLGGKAAGNATKKDISSYDFRDPYVLVLPVDTDVSYMDENGKEKNHECTMIRIPDRKTEIRFENDGWYALYDKQVLDTRIVNNADSSHPAHLILMDGCSLTSTRGISNKSGKALIIYGQNRGTGELNINTGTSWDAGIGGDDGTGAGNLTVCGGKINITSNGRGAAIGGGHKGNGGTLNVYNGKVDVYCTDLGAGIGGGGNMTTTGGGGAYVNVFGGTIDATCDGAGAAIGGGGVDFKWRGGGNGGSLVFCEGEITAYSARAHGIGAGNCANNQDLGYMGSIVAGKDTTVEFGESPENHPGSGLAAYTASPNHYIRMKSKEGVYVSFHTDGGSSVEPQEITSGEKAVRPADPTKAGYKFMGWYADSACTGDPFDFASVITKDTILYAKWEIDPGQLECPVYWYLDDAGKLTIASYALPSLEGKAKVHGAFDANHTFAECADTWADHKESIKRVYSATEVNPRYCDHWFEDCYYLESADLTALGTAGTSNIISMASMFSYCTALSYINLSNVNTSNVTDMSYMFEECASLSSVEFGDSSAAAFQTGKVSRMDGMFKSCSSLKNIDLRSFDFQNVTDLSEFLFMCDSLETITWPENPDVSKVTTFWRTFSYCGSLKALDLSGFTASGAAVTEEMLKKCSLLEEIDVSGFAASPLEDIISMFEGYSSLRTIYALDTQAFCSNSVTLSENAFTGCQNLAGGNGTKYDALRTDKSLAKVDKEGVEGYFTQKGTGTVLLVTYVENNGNRPKQETVLSGEKATNYTPEYPGSRFLGWFRDPELTASYSFDTPVTADITLYAKWEQLDKISVSFNTMGGSYIEPQIIVQYTKAATPSVVPEKPGHTFAGWYQEEGCTNTFDFNQEISANTTVYAKWIAEEYTVTWLVEGQEASSSTYTYGAMPSYGGTPVKTGHTFVGWEPSLKPVTEVTTYTALFDKGDDTTHVVYFDGNGGTVSPVFVSVTDEGSGGYIPAEEVPKAEREGHTFNVWKDSVGNLVEDVSAVLIDKDGIVFTADWSVNQIEITWDVDGTKTPVSYNYGAMPVYNNGTDPVKTGYIFAGWDPAVVPATTPSTYTAKFMEDEQFTVFFNTMGGSPVSTQIVEKGAKAARPSAVPKKDGYTFSDWFKDKDCKDPFIFENEVINKSITVYAGWTPDKYSVTWSWLKADGTEGSLTEVSKYEYGQLPVFPEGSKEQLKKPGYVHTGWNPLLQ